ncbi:peptidoglycan DD-metalloendopeptidase family protein [Cellulomonas sp. ICMP 17802]|uniref:peptidoglycan DD-metalloendopeptidase family protein n=1 Tax=Cellulomonas sp. ICMP 17802 TaxID=3239199 RepID=UPI00351B6869
MTRDPAAASTPDPPRPTAARHSDGSRRAASRPESDGPPGTATPLVVEGSGGTAFRPGSGGPARTVSRPGSGGPAHTASRLGSGGPPRTAAARTAVGSGVVAVLVALVLAVLASAGSAGPAESSGPPEPGTYRLPLAGLADVARGFEPPPRPWAAGHRGVDLRAVAAASVLSPVDGVVTFAGAVAGRGVVTVTDASGRRSSLEPVLTGVRVGDAVVAGQALGILTTEGSHCAPATCLHWGVRVGDDYVDPLALLPGAGPVVLLSSGAASTGPSIGAVRRARPRAGGCAAGPSRPCASARCATR